ncbi:hypothetical protein B0T10DRAFT_304838 [Thelonectria olida]|uniref:Uncharacterized protein n=1 Tax=Thelonectria olida TaxID=1576542 RepID=A0A9P9AQE1_9HYPO|nr:hypothetical protein B0T10DRAFT_304838 [Thelonectria olida]
MLAVRTNTYHLLLSFRSNQTTRRRRQSASRPKRVQDTEQTGRAGSPCLLYATCLSCGVSRAEIYRSRSEDEPNDMRKYPCAHAGRHVQSPIALRGQRWASHLSRRDGHHRPTSSIQPFTELARTGGPLVGRRWRWTRPRTLVRVRILPTFWADSIFRLGVPPSDCSSIFGVGSVIDLVCFSGDSGSVCWTNLRLVRTCLYEVLQSMQ